ncbi:MULTISPECIES: DUF6303 family protein [unclassified Streptomyces]|uniref:DUF6303 family protein n=1 Tax=unclassified Streptomyces TaxID=2593676 RepID=UPI003716BB61
MTCSAHLANPFTGEWELYIVLQDRRATDWPAYDFKRVSTPTRKERSEALALLGYEPVNTEDAWEWLELPAGDEDRVQLLASLDVRPVKGGGES